MGEVKKNISQLSKDAGGMAKAASAAEDWFNTSKKAWRDNLKIFRSSELIERKNNDLLIKIINKELGNVKI